MSSTGERKRSRSGKGPKDKRASKASRTTKPVKVTMQEVKRAVAAEKRKNAGYVDLAVASYPTDNAGAAGSIALIATIAQGAGQTQRIGKKATYKSLQVRGYVQNNTTATLNDVAICIVYDKEPTGLMPNITDIFNQATAQSFLNDTNSDRFQIVRRWSHVLTGNSATPATGNEILDIDEYIDLKSRPVQFKAAATGAIGDIAVGALYLVCLGSSNPGTTASTSFLGFRTRFVDTEG